MKITASVLVWDELDDALLPDGMDRAAARVQRKLWRAQRKRELQMRADKQTRGREVLARATLQATPSPRSAARAQGALTSPKAAAPTGGGAGGGAGAGAGACAGAGAGTGDSANGAHVAPQAVTPAARPPPHSVASVIKAANDVDRLPSPRVGVPDALAVRHPATSPTAGKSPTVPAKPKAVARKIGGVPIKRKVAHGARAGPTKKKKRAMGNKKKKQGGLFSTSISKIVLRK